jgi:hypothetical protein
MASFTGITAAKADQILGQSVVSGYINPSGHLILTRQNGSTIDAGDFTGIVTGILNQQVTDAVASAVPTYVAGTTVNKGTINGAVTFTEFNTTNLINALITATLNGNITINAADLPANPRANTQFAMRLTQDATGGRTVAFTSFKKSQGVLQLTPTANTIDILVFFYDGVQWFVGLMGADLK